MAKNITVEGKWDEGKAIIAANVYSKPSALFCSIFTIFTTPETSFNHNIKIVC